MFASGTTGQGESRAPGPTRGRHAVKTLSPTPLTTPMSTRKEKSLSDSSSQDSTNLLQPPTRANSANEAGAGRGRAGPGAAWQEAARTFRCRRSRWLLPGPLASCVRSCRLLFPARAHWAVPALWLRPQTAYPVNCEVSPAWPFLGAHLTAKSLTPNQRPLSALGNLTRGFVLEGGPVPKNPPHFFLADP